MAYSLLSIWVKIVVESGQIRLDLLNNRIHKNKLHLLLGSVEVRYMLRKRRSLISLVLRSLSLLVLFLAVIA